MARIVQDCEECKTSDFECAHCPDCGRHLTTSVPKGTWFMWSGHCGECSVKRDLAQAGKRRIARVQWITARLAEMKEEGAWAVLGRIYDSAS